MINFILHKFRHFQAICAKYPSCPELSASKLEIGQYGEAYTKLYLEKKGYLILHKNLRLHGNEIDIIAQKDNQILFCEVKTRYYAEGWLEQYGSPSKGITQQQIHNIKSAAASYIKRFRSKFSYRFDVAEVYLGQGENSYQLQKFNYIEDAFR